MTDLKTPVVADVPPVPPPEPTPPVEVNATVIDELRQNRNPEDLAAATQALENSVYPQLKVVEVLPPASDQPVVPAEPGAQPIDQPAAETPVKQFTMNVRGNNVSYDDSDGYFGNENFGRMKKQYVYAKEETAYQTELAEDARKRAENAVTAQFAAENRVKELEGKVTQFEAQPPVLQPAAIPPTPAPAPAAVQPPVVADVPVLERPLLPTRPNISANPVDWDDEDKAAQGVFNSQMHEYNAKFSDYTVSLIAQKPAPVSAPVLSQQYVDDMKNMKDGLNEIQGTLSVQKQDNAVAEQTRQNDAYWNGLDSFRSKNTAEFGDPATSRPLRDIHKDILPWTDNLAQILGGQKPFTPFDPNAADWSQYEIFKTNAVSQYLAGDPTVLAKIEGSVAAKAPAEVKEYYKMLDVINYSTTQKQAKVLGENAPLEDAYLHQMHHSGVINDGVKAVTVEAASLGAQAAIDVLQDQAVNTATNLPNDLQARPPGEQLSDAQKQEILSMTGPQLAAASPEKRDQYNKVVKDLQAVTYGQPQPHPAQA